MTPTILPLVPAPPPPPPVFAHIGIVGLGPVGISLGLASRRRWPSALVIGVDANEVLEQAIRLHAVDVAAGDLTILSGADLVVVAGPADQGASTLERLADHLDGAVVVTATWGTDNAVEAAARHLPPRVVFVAGGLTAAHDEAAEAGRVPCADVLEGRTWRLAPPGPSPAQAEAHQRLSAFLAALGVRVEVDPPTG